MTVETSDAAERALAEVVADADKPTEVESHEDRTREMKTPGFSRMRTDWDGPDGTTVAAVREVVDRRILANFADAFALMNEVYDIVRDPEADEVTGDVKTDRYGFPVWRRTPTGAYVEDFTKLSSGQKEDLLFKITTRIFEWEQAAADAWGEAMFAKAQWEEAFAVGFTTAKTGSRITDEMGTQVARANSRDERYFAVFLSLYSRKADAIVRSMQLLGQRLKDTLG